jgi:4'-phosphopantetheinyl transferase
MLQSNGVKVKVLTPTLGPKDVHVWSISLAGRGLPSEAGCAELLSAAERDRLARLRTGESRVRFALSHAATRVVLGAYAGAEPARLELRYESGGRPEPVDGDLHWSLSHSSRLALVGVGRGAPLGVDVEHVRPLHDAPALARRVLTSEEHARWASEPTTPALLRLWVRKEAVVKATGEGLSRPLDELSVLDPAGVDGLRLIELESVVSGYVAAVAVRADMTDLAHYTFSWEDNAATADPR